MISVILIDQDLMFCQLLQKIVSDREITVIGEATTGAKGIELIRKHKQKSPLVVLINTQLSDMSGEAVCRFVHRHWPHMLCIYLLNIIHWPTLNRLIYSPAKGFVTKEACYLSLDAIRMVGNGKTYLQPDLALGLLDYRAQPAILQSPFAKLSVREYEILNLLAKNKTYEEIVGIMHISIKTVYNLKVSAFKKLTITSHEQLCDLMGHYADCKSHADDLGQS